MFCRMVTCSSRPVIVPTVLTATQLVAAAWSAASMPPLLPGGDGLLDTWIVDGRVTAEAVANGVAYAGGRLYVGGRFTTLAGSPRNLAGAFDLATGDVTAWDPAIGGTGFVGAIAAADGSVVLGGGFDSVDGVPRANLVAVDPVTGWVPTVSSDVYALDVTADTVYAGLEYGNSAEAFDRGSAATLGWAPVPPDDVVYAVVVDGDEVLLGGEFGQLDGQPRARLGAVDATTGAVTPWNPGADGNVHDLAVDGTTDAWSSVVP